MEHESLRMEEVTNAIIKIFNPLTPRSEGSKTHQPRCTFVAAQLAF